MIKNRKLRYILFLSVILILHLCLILWYGRQKRGFHIDEYYSTLTSTGREMEFGLHGGLNWQSGQDLLERFTVDPEKPFQFGQVIWLQEQDVHPPLYYLSLNVVMSLFPGRFSKWFAIALNAVYSCVSLLGIGYLFYRLDKREHKTAALGACLTYALSTARLSNVMLNRMYTLSAMWTVLFACLFVTMILDHGGSYKRWLFYLLAGMGICYLSFLTHYFCLLTAGMLTVGYCIFTLAHPNKKTLLQTGLFGLGLLLSIYLGFRTYPAAVNHIFHNYRGTEAFGRLAEAEFLEFVRIAVRIMGNNIFSGFFYALVLLTLFLWIIKFFRKDRDPGEVFLTGWIFVSTLLVMLLLMKLALQTNAAMRFYYPAAALMLPLMGYLFCDACLLIKKEESRVTKSACILLLLLFLGFGHVRGYMEYLFPDIGEDVNFSVLHKDIPCLYVYNTKDMVHVWEEAAQLWPYEHILYVSNELMTQPFEDPVVEQFAPLLVYLDHEGTQVIDNFLQISNVCTKSTLIRHDNTFYVYMLE